MSVQTEIDRIINAVDAAHTKVAEKGGTTARPYLVGNLADAIASIPEAKEPVLQPYKTVIPSTSHQSVVPDEGYDGLLEVKVGAVPTAERAKPSLSVSDAGLITVTSRQPEGYVEGGVETVTRQLQTTSGGMVIRPGTARKVAAYDSTYITGGNLYVDGDANLVADNIKSGVSIFGVAGSYEGEGGGSSGDAGTCNVSVTFKWSRLGTTTRYNPQITGIFHENENGYPAGIAYSQRTSSTPLTTTTYTFATKIGSYFLIEPKVSDDPAIASGGVSYNTTLENGQPLPNTFPSFFRVTGDGAVVF